MVNEQDDGGEGSDQISDVCWRWNVQKKKGIKLDSYVFSVGNKKKDEQLTREHGERNHFLFHVAMLFDGKYWELNFGCINFYVSMRHQAEVLTSQLAISDWSLGRGLD